MADVDLGFVRHFQTDAYHAASTGLFRLWSPNRHPSPTDWKEPCEVVIYGRTGLRLRPGEDRKYPCFLVAENATDIFEEFDEL